MYLCTLAKCIASIGECIGSSFDETKRLRLQREIVLEGDKGKDNRELVPRLIISK